MVVVPQKVASWLLVQTNLQKARRIHAGRDAEIDAVLIALALAAMETRPGSGLGNRPAPNPELPAGSTPRTVTTKAVADQLNITVRAVVRAIADNRLTAVKNDEGRWRIGEGEAARFVDQHRKDHAA